MVSRTILRSSGGCAARTIVSTTGVPFAPRTFAIAWSSVRPSTLAPSIPVTTSPSRSPAASAGDAAIAETTVIRQSGASVVHAPPPAAEDRAAMTAPIPSNWPPRSSRARWRSAGLMYEEYGSPSALINPSMAPSTSFFWSTGPT